MHGPARAGPGRPVSDVQDYDPAEGASLVAGMTFDHIGVFCRSLPDGMAVLKATLPIVRASEEFHDPGLRISCQFLWDSAGVCYETVAPLGEGNPVEGSLKSGRNILNHVAYTVDDVDAAMAYFLARQAYTLAEPKPAVAFGGRRVAFVLTPMLFILELIER